MIADKGQQKSKIKDSKRRQAQQLAIAAKKDRAMRKDKQQREKLERLEYSKRRQSNAKRSLTGCGLSSPCAAAI